jgi:hypothetical protein
VKLAIIFPLPISWEGETDKIAGEMLKRRNEK